MTTKQHNALAKFADHNQTPSDDDVKNRKMARTAARKAAGGALPTRNQRSTETCVQKWGNTDPFEIVNQQLMFDEPVDASGLMPFICSSLPHWDDATGNGVCGSAALHCATGGFEGVVKNRLSNATYEDLVQSLKNTPFKLIHAGNSFEDLLSAVYRNRKATLVVLLNWTGKSC
jgi:hypothetical protein